MSVMGKASLALLNKIGITPSIKVSNDQFTGLVPAFGKGDHFGETLKNTIFFHILFNFSSGNEGCDKNEENKIINNNNENEELNQREDKKSKNEEKKIIKIKNENEELIKFNSKLVIYSKLRKV